MASTALWRSDKIFLFLCGRIPSISTPFLIQSSSDCSRYEGLSPHNLQLFVQGVFFMTLRKSTSTLSPYSAVRVPASSGLDVWLEASGNCQRHSNPLRGTRRAWRHEHTKRTLIGQGLFVWAFPWYMGLLPCGILVMFNSVVGNLWGCETSTVP